MGAIFKNNILYSGMEEESNMKYDPVADKKYLKNADGEWVEVGYGGLSHSYLYKNGNRYTDITGDWVVDSANTSTSGTSYNLDKNGSLYVSVTNAVITLQTSKSDMDLSGYNSLRISYSVDVPHNASSNSAYIVLLNGTTEIAKKSFDVATTETGVWEIDLTGNQEAVSSCRLKIYMAESGTGTLFISEMILVNTESTDNIPKHPTTNTTISSDFTSGNTYTADEDCWVVAVATLESATEYGILTIYDVNLPVYQDKEIAYGANGRTFLVKLYVKKGTNVIVNGQGSISAISLYKLV